ncbi:hypothetical protein [Zavarzinella formosa]|uniref:hypothetical protein n=1 Tax=Zavarzinella formosa TaxID=360055 RepID=UPI0002DDF26C|nr:hypothetical protein [Zavarzinella formosa]
MQALRWAIASLLGVVIVLSVGDSSVTGQTKKDAKDKKEEAKKGDWKLTIYDDENFKGRNIILRNTFPDLQASHKFGSSAESIKWSVPPGKAMVLCEDKGYVRPVLVLVGDGEEKDLGKNQRNALHRIRSVIYLPCKKGEWPAKISKDVPKIGEESDE